MPYVKFLTMMEWIAEQCPGGLLVSVVIEQAFRMTHEAHYQQQQRMTHQYTLPEPL